MHSTFTSLYGSGETSYGEWYDRYGQTPAFQTFCSKVKVLHLNLDYFHRSASEAAFDERSEGTKWASCYRRFFHSFPNLQKIEFLVYGKKENRIFMLGDENDLLILKLLMRSFIGLLPQSVEVEISEQFPMSNKVILSKAKLEGLLRLDTLRIVNDNTSSETKVEASDRVEEYNLDCRRGRSKIKEYSVRPVDIISLANLVSIWRGLYDLVGC